MEVEFSCAAAAVGATSSTVVSFPCTGDVMASSAASVFSVEFDGGSVTDDGSSADGMDAFASAGVGVPSCAGVKSSPCFKATGESIVVGGGKDGVVEAVTDSASTSRESGPSAVGDCSGESGRGAEVGERGFGGPFTMGMSWY